MPLVAAAVPVRLAVPLPLLAKVTPLGNAPVSVKVGVGAPVAVTRKLPPWPTTKVALLPLVMTGGDVVVVTVNVAAVVVAVPALLVKTA